jgi:hypothetical protein
MKVGNDNTIYFWTNRWIGDTPLFYAYPQLFALACHPSITVASIFVQEISNLEFKQALVGSQNHRFPSIIIGCLSFSIDY